MRVCRGRRWDRRSAAPYGQRALRRAYFRAPANQTNRWLVVIGGANDLNRYCQPATAVAARITDLSRQARRRGWRLVVCTVTPMSPKTVGLVVPYARWESERVAYNAWLRGHWGGIADGFVDLAADPHFTDPEDRRYAPWLTVSTTVIPATLWPATG